MPELTRRQWLAYLGSIALLQEARRGCTLSIGTYSLRGIPLERAIGVV